MPYKSVSEVPDSVPKGKRKQWMEVWNSAYDSCISDGKSQKSCESSAFAQANAVVKKDDSIMNDVLKLFRQLGEKLTAFFASEEERSVSLPEVYQQVSTLLDKRYQDGESTQWEWLTDIYTDEGNLFAIVAAGGKLYRSDVTVSGSDISIGELSEVVHDFKPAESRMVIRRQADDSYRMFIISGTTVLNRNGEIDSAELFDKMIQRVEESGEYPFLDFFHLGRSFYMGTADWLARDGAVVLASVPMEDNPVSQAMIRAYEKDPEYWGSSNSFYPIGSPEMWEVAEDIKIPVYRDGKYHSITILPEKDACSLFTSLQGREEINRMDKRVLEALSKLADEDEEVMSSLVNLVDGVNRSVEENNLIHRENPVEGEAETEVQSEDTETEEVSEESGEVVVEQPSEIEIGEEVVEEVTKKVFENESWTGLAETVRSLVEQVSNISLTLATLTDKTEKRLSSLEVTEERKKKRYLDDLPGGRSKTTVTYRPKEQAVADPAPDKKSLQEVANETLSHFDD